MDLPSEIVRVELPGDAHFLIEASLGSGRPGEEQDVAVTDRLLSLEPVMRTIEQLAVGLSAALNRAAPQTAQVEFGLELAVEPGGLTALIVRGGGTATLKITLGWSTT